MDLLKDLIEQDDYMQHQMKQKLGPNPLLRGKSQQPQADREPKQPEPRQDQQAPRMGQMPAQPDQQMGGDKQAANETAKQAVKLLRQSAQALAPSYNGSEKKAMEYILGRIQDYFDAKLRD